MIEVQEDKIVIYVSSLELKSMGLNAEKGLLMPSKKVYFALAGEAVKLDEDIDEFVKKYRDLFPADKKGNRKKTTENMIKFFKEFPEYPRNLILAVTANYIKEKQRSRSGQFIMFAQYFIYKRETGSELEGQCERFLNTGLSLEDLEEDGGRWN